MHEPKIIVLDDAASLHVRAAEEIAHAAGEAVCLHGEFTLCLAGGDTPRAAYELLATRFQLSVDWKAVQFFWGDERCVPPEDEASNFRMASRSLLSRLELTPAQIHRMRGEDPPKSAALAYEDELRAFFSAAQGEPPRFDLLLLGLGDNAHIASLFPKSPALHEPRRLVVAVEVDAPQRHRLSLTPPVINAAHRVMFMVSGEGKAEAVRNVLRGPADPDRFPGQIVRPEGGEVIWLLDQPAARLLG